MGLNAFIKMFYIELLKFVKFALCAHKKLPHFKKTRTFYRKNTYGLLIKKLNL